MDEVTVERGPMHVSNAAKLSFDAVTFKNTDESQWRKTLDMQECGKALSTLSGLQRHE
jgi:hypothetical protein